MMDPCGLWEQSGRIPAVGGGRSAETWRGHIVQQLKNRDLRQSAMFQDLIRFYTQLLEKTSLTKGILNLSSRRPSAEDSRSVSSLLQQKSRLKKTSGELAYQVVELQHQIKIKECRLQEQQDRSSFRLSQQEAPPQHLDRTQTLSNTEPRCVQVSQFTCRLQEEERRWADVFDAHRALQERVDQVHEANRLLKKKYDELLAQQREAESRLRTEKVREEGLLGHVMGLKKQAAARMNSRNERRSRAREATLQKQLQTAVRSKVSLDSSSSAPTSRSTSPKNECQDEDSQQGHARLFRSASVTSPRIFTSIRHLFDRKRRGHSVCSYQEDLPCPVGICVSARVPARALQVLEAHEQGINAVRFSCSSDLLATGGTDRVIKLWEVQAGSLTHRATLDGSTEGITSVQFDHTGQRILAASYDKSAMLWRLDDSVPKVTLTGHSRKVTAARFTCVLHQVVTGSADRTVRLWDLNRAACVQQAEMPSFCSDVVCSENSVISGHLDCKIRVWDSRVASCVQELPAQGKVTSLDLSSDHRQLLSCCRDNCLQLVDLRWSNNRVCFRADGFKCGSDSTKAVISPDSCYLAAGSADGTVYIWNVSTGNLETCLPERHNSSISAVSWSLSGEYVVSVDRSRRAVLWSDI